MEEVSEGDTFRQFQSCQQGSDSRLKFQNDFEVVGRHELSGAGEHRMIRISRPFDQARLLQAEAGFVDRPS
jgi:hypothetical protein